jgi:hypothetical protein
MGVDFEEGIFEVVNTPLPDFEQRCRDGIYRPAPTLDWVSVVLA